MAAVNTYALEESTSTDGGPVYTDTGRARQARANLYPPGLAYRAADIEGTNMYAVNAGLARATERLEHDVRSALTARDPRQAYAYLEDWEDALDLPDTPNASPDPRVRRQVAYQKLVGEGGQSPDFFIQVAEDLGYLIEVEHALYDAAFYCGNDADSDAQCGVATCSGEDIGHFLIIHVQGAAANAELESAITRYLHSHAVVVFAYDI